MTRKLVKSCSLSQRERGSIAAPHFTFLSMIKQAHAKLKWWMERLRSPPRMGRVRVGCKPEEQSFGGQEGKLIIEVIFVRSTANRFDFNMSPTPLLPLPSREGISFNMSLQRSVPLTQHILPPSGENLLTFHCNPSSKSKISVLPQGEDNNFSIQTNEMLTMPSGKGLLSG